VAAVNVGICAFWFNRGQGVVARQLRSALDELGHRTFVLGRPTKESFPMPQEAREDDVWAQEGVTAASDFFIPADELVGWAGDHDLDACFFDQNYEFDSIERLRASGVRTIGRFVWERFSPEHVPAATRAYETIYSMTRAERERYAEMGIDAPFLRWGIHPEYERIEPHRDGRRPGSDEPPAEGAEAVYFHYHAGLLGKRKPFRQVIEAFSATDDPRLRLIVKAQIERRMKFLATAARRDRRIELVLEDLPTDRHLQMCADAHVCMAPARWEGLGLHLYEAIAFEQPIVCNDDPPMNELIGDGENGLLVPSHDDGEANSGIPARTVDVPGLSRAIERLADPGLRDRLERGAGARRAELSWDRVRDGVAELLQ
jgi:1,2-diacylglycerol 3-alpha-glucosyltransferase